jgi:hypothetical protein
MTKEGFLALFIYIYIYIERINNIIKKMVHTPTFALLTAHYLKA